MNQQPKKTLTEKSAHLFSFICKKSAVFFSNKACFSHYNQPKEDEQIKNLRKF